MGRAVSLRGVRCHWEEWGALRELWSHIGTEVTLPYATFPSPSALLRRPITQRHGLKTLLARSARSFATQQPALTEAHDCPSLCGLMLRARCPPGVLFYFVLLYAFLPVRPLSARR